MAQPINAKLTSKQYLNYKKHQIKKNYKQFKKIWIEDIKKNWESYLIIIGGTFLGYLVSYCMLVL